MELEEQKEEGEVRRRRRYSNNKNPNLRIWGKIAQKPSKQQRKYYNFSIIKRIGEQEMTSRTS